MGKRKDLTGLKYGRLLVLEQTTDYVTPGGRKMPRWKCRCDCGNVFITYGWSITSGDVKSCGCLARETKRKKRGSNTFDISAGVCRMSNDKTFLFDPDDYATISQYTWHIGSAGYPTTYTTKDGKKTVILLHSLLVKYEASKEEVDHINGDKTDNRKQNLRIVSHANNLKNLKLAANNTSGHKGVSWDKNCKKWFAYINCNNVRYALGRYGNIADAIKARELAEEALFGEYKRAGEYL